MIAVQEYIYTADNQQESEDPTDAVAKGVLTKSENRSFIDFPNSFSIVLQTCINKIDQSTNDIPGGYLDIGNIKCINMDT